MFLHRPVPKPIKATFKKNGRTYAIVPCSVCGVDLERRKDQVNQRGTGDFCKECLRNRNSVLMKGNKNNPVTRKKLVCKQCGKEFYFVKSKLNTRKFCNRNCYNVWHRNNIKSATFISNKLSGKDHPNYKHGKRVGKHVGKPLLRKRIIERDGGEWCLICGKSGPGLHLHRVIYGSQCGKYEVDNCVLLCGGDHALIHSNKRKYQPILLDYLNGTPSEDNRVALRAVIQRAERSS